MDLDADADAHVQRRGVTELSGMNIQPPTALQVLLFYCTYWGLCVFDAVRDNSVLYLIGYFLCSVLGYFKNEFFFAYHLGDVVIRNETVKSVLRAVVHNGKQLMMTSLLCSVIVYVYSILGFWAFRDMYVLETAGGGVDHMCDNVLDCFLFTLNNGLRSGGGIGDVLENATSYSASYMNRLIFDLTFFVIVVVILLNVIFGIIIDTFADLRSISQAKIEDMKTMCYICNMPRHTLDRLGDGFDNHVAHDHNMWAYVNYLVHIRLKEKTELTGLESDVWDKILKQDTSFFPLHKALCLEGVEEEEEREKEDALKRMDRLVQDVASIKQALTAHTELLRALTSQDSTSQ